jgi:hypothetical protein
VTPDAGVPSVMTGLWPGCWPHSKPVFDERDGMDGMLLLRIGQQAGGLSLFNKRVRLDAKIAALPWVHPKLKKARVGFQPTPENSEIYVSRWRRGSESDL